MLIKNPSWERGRLARLGKVSPSGTHPVRAFVLMLAAALLVACSSAENISSSQVDTDDTNNSDTNNSDSNNSNGVNSAPTANAGADQEVDIGATVTLDASASSDTDGSIVAYHWSQTAGIDVSIDDSTSQVATFVVPQSAIDSNLSFELIVIDDDDTYANDSLIIVVSATNPDDSVPVADAGADQRVNEGTTVTLDASASSAAGGSIATYQWTQADGTEVIISNATSAQASFVAPQVDSDSNLLFHLTVTNTNGAVGNDNIVITVLNNAAPTANAGVDAQANASATVQLDGSASADADGSIVSYSWQQIDSSGYSVSLSDATAAQPTFTAPAVAAETVLSFELTVTDDDGSQDTDTVGITILANAAPTANAGVDLQVYEDNTVQLDGSASSDSDGSISAYSWQQIDSSGFPVSLSDATAVQPTFTAPAVSADTALSFELTVTDDSGAQASDTVAIAIIYNNPPVASVGADQSVNENTSVQLDASASSDIENSSLTYSWQQVDSSGYAISLSDASSAQPTFTTPEVSADTDLIFQLTVTDSLGKSSEANSTISVIYNSPPTANAGSNQSVNENASVQLDASASSDLEDEDSSLAYSWQQIDNSGYTISLSDASSALPSFTTPEVAADTDLIFQLTVTDSLGKSSDANSTISVIYNNPPTASVGADQSANENASVQLSGSASSDVEDSSLAYSWQQVDSSGYSISLNDTSSANPTFTTPEVAADTNLTFQLTVTDSLGKSSDANSTISVVYNNPPTANAGSNQSVNENQLVELDASASSDSEDEDSSLTYSWQQVDSSGYSVSLSDANSVLPSFTAPEVAADTDLIFQLTVTDSLGKSDDANSTISVIYNNPPTASVSADQSVNENQLVELDASASSDVEDSSLTYLWQQVDSSGYTISLSDTTTALPSFTTPEVAANTDLIFQLTVTDSLGKSDDANSTISVIYNNPPTANAGADQSVNESISVQLDGSASSDIEDSSLSYLWQQVDSSGYTISLSDASSAQPTFTTPEVAADTDLILQLTVTDSLGKSSDANATISIIYNSPPIASVGANQEVDEGDSVQLYGSGSSDIEDSNLAYSWQQVDSSGYSVTLSDANTANPTFTAPEVESSTNLIFQLTVTDSLGKSSDANQTITVGYNSPPSANAGANTQVNEGDSVQLDGSASSDLEDEDSSLAYSWQQVDSSGYTTSLSDANTATPSFTAPNPVAADTDLIFQLTVTDSLGKSSDANVTITIIYNNPPEANAGGNQSVNEGTTVQLDGSDSSDLEDEASSLTYSWQQVDSSGYSITLSDPNTATPSFTTPNPVAATTDLTFNLKVTDSLGKSSEDSVIIRVTYNNPPEANAGANQSVNEGATVQLDASASSDSETSNLAYSWQQVDSSGYFITLSDPNSATPSFTTPEVAADTDLIFQLTVTDSLSKSSDANVTISITYNSPPSANAGADQEVDEGDTVQLDASASSDLEDEDSNLAYSWQQVDSSGYSITLSNPTTATPSFTAPEVAADTDLIFQLTVTDSLGKSSDANVTITVIYNNPPTADAGSGAIVDENQFIELDGSGSSDPEGSSLDYLWQQVDDSGFTITLSDDAVAQPTFTTPYVETTTDLSFQLTVTDAGSKSSSDTISFRILYNHPPNANAGTDQKVNEGDSVQLSASASSDIEDEDTSLTYSWQQVDSSGYTITLSDANTANPSFNAPEVAADTDLIFQLTVTDSLGKSSDANVTISITYNSPPTANAGSNQEVDEGAIVQLSGSASSDLEDSSLTYSWQQVDSSGHTITLSDANIANPTFTAPNPVADTALTFNLKVTDSLGKTDQDAVVITVLYNNPPTANAGANAQVNEGDSIQLDASASSDSEDSSLTYSWQQVDSSGYTISLSGADTATPSFTAPEVAADTDLIFQLTVTDSLGKSSDANVTITVIYNTPPTATAGANQSVNESQVVQLDASASSDLEDEDSSLTYSWQQSDSSGYTITLSDPAITSPTFTAPEVPADTALTFNLTVTDSLGKSDQDAVTITVLNNIPPTANAGSYQSVAESSPVQLDASASSDSETSNLAYSWQQVDSSGYTITLSDSSIAKPTFTAPRVSTDTDLDFELTVTDAGGKSSTDTVTITVLNAPPLTVDASIDNSQATGTIASLRGSTSSSSNFIASYLWQETTSHGIAIDRADSVNASFVVPASLTAGDVISFQFTVTDTTGASASATTSITIATPGTLKWHYDTGVRVQSSPAIDADGTVYFGANDGNLYALNPQDGSLKWSFATGGVIETPPTIAADGTVYFGSSDGNIYAVSAPTDGSQSGVQKWYYEDAGLEFSEHTSVSIAADGTLYFGSRANYLYAFDPNGIEQWSYPTGSSIMAAPAISSTGTIYFGSGDKIIYAINPPSGSANEPSLLWSYDTGSFLTWTSPAIGANGTVYNGSWSGDLFALNSANGVFQWSYEANDDIQTSPVIATDGTIYFGSRDDYLYAFDPDSSATYKWAYQTGGNVDSSPVIGADDTVYFGSDDDHVYALAPDGKEQWHYDLGTKVFYSSAALAPDGTLFIGGVDGLYAIYTASAGLAADSPWPKFGQNNRSTGRVNLAPSADAGSEQTVAPGDIVKLDASNSSDSDGAIINYYWRETSGYGINIIGNSGAQASFTAPTPSANDTLTIELTVTDNHDTPHTTTLNINIEI